MPPFFSIVIPVYNVAPYLRECLDSILAQTFKEWEAICVDDGSTDCSGTILDEYSAKDSRFRVIHQLNVGVSIARNRALHEVRGSWIGFVDSDDIVAPKWLAEVHNLIEKTGIGFIRMSVSRFKDGGPIPEVDFDTSYKVIRGRQRVDAWGVNELTRHGYVWLVFQKTMSARSVLFPEGVKFAEDALRNLALLKRCDEVCQSEYAGYFYRSRPASASLQRYSAIERRALFEYCETIIPESGQLRRFAGFLWANLVCWACRHEKCSPQEAKMLHGQFKQLMKKAGISASLLKFHWRIPYFMYIHAEMTRPIVWVNLTSQIVSRGVRWLYGKFKVQGVSKGTIIVATK